MGILGPEARADLERYRFYDQQSGMQRSTLTTIFAHQGLQAILLYRVMQSLRVGKRTWFRTKMLALYPAASRINDILTGINISPAATIGPGCFIAHSGGVVIGPGATIGSNCNIGNNVTIGGGAPTVGDRVMVAVGSKVLGDVRVGSDAAVGANAVVVRDIEPRAVAVGAPAKVISYAGAFEHVLYPGADSDEARLAALDEAPPSPPRSVRRRT